MADTPMPPWMRRIQQNPTIAYIGPPIVMVASIAFYKAYELSNEDITQMTSPHMWAGLNAAVAYAIPYVLGRLWGHTSSSPCFHPDGTPNKVVTDIVSIQKAADDGHPQMQAAVDNIGRKADEAMSVLGAAKTADEADKAKATTDAKGKV